MHLGHAQCAIAVLGAQARLAWSGWGHPLPLAHPPTSLVGLCVRGACQGMTANVDVTCRAEHPVEALGFIEVLGTFVGREASRGLLRDPDGG